MERDKFMGAPEALEMGLVDEILERREMARDSAGKADETSKEEK